MRSAGKDKCMWHSMKGDTEAHQRLISLEKENVSKHLGSTYYVPGIVLSKLYIPRDI